MIKSAKITAFIIGLLTLLWQIMQILKGNSENMFLIADVILSIFLMVAAFLKEKDKGLVFLMLAFSFSAGVFSVATFGGLTTKTYNFGAFTTTLGLIPSVIFAVLLSKRITKSVKPG